MRPPDAAADYVNTGHWSERTIREARRFVSVAIAADEADSQYTTVPEPASLRPSPGAAYLHYTPNETIGGVEFPYVPETGSVPLVADMSSSILSRPLDVSRFGLIYAGAQKNIGPSGITVVIVSDACWAARVPARRLSSTTAPWPMRARCSIRHRPSGGTWRASCSSG